MFETVLGRLMMRMYREAVNEDDTNAIHAEVEEGWKLLLRKDGNLKQYCNALLKRE